VARMQGAKRRQMTDEQIHEHLFDERARIAARGRVRQFVFGSLDGLLVPLGVVSGVAGGTGNLHAVVVAGLAEAFAGALSMGAGEYLSGRAEVQVQRYEIEREGHEIQRNPEVERREIAALFEREGIPPESARQVSRIIATSPEAWLKTMAEKELGLSVDGANDQWIDSLYMGISYLVASSVPLLPYFFLSLRLAFVVSLVATLVALLIIGYVKGTLAHMNILRSALEVVVVGSISGLGGYFLGNVVPSLFGK
jgi:VIT1/CCC1 family predicted Fe2+/Mn2+ transporter